MRILVSGDERHVLNVLGAADVTVVRGLAGVRRWLRTPKALGEVDVAIVTTDALGVRASARIVDKLTPHGAVALFGRGALPASLERACDRHGDRCWPMESVDDLGRFMRFAAALAHAPATPVALAVADLANRWNLTPHLAQVLALSTTHATSEQMCGLLGVSANTLKTHSRRLLHVAGVDSLDRVGKVVLRVALARAQEGVLEGDRP